MQSMAVSINHFSRLGKIRRIVLILTFLTIILASIHHIVVKYFEKGKYVSGGLSRTIRTAAPYNKYIDEAGRWIYFEKIQILQHVIKPDDHAFDEFYLFLDQNDEWKLYFEYIPIANYHIVLAELKVRSAINDEDMEKLRREQYLLDELLVDFKGKVRRVILEEKKEIRFEIEYKNETFEKHFRSIQKRWQESFPSLIVDLKTTFSIIVAVQYKDLPSKELTERIRQALTAWEQWHMEMEFDPIEICTSSNLITFEPIVP